MQALGIMLLASGLVTLQFTWSQEVQPGKCIYAGVIHLEGIVQYSLDYPQAKELCQELGYSLATEEQLTKAYNQGLKTCRYGWIEGQKASFLPNDADPNCTVNSAGITSHVEEEDKLYDVYCFTHSESLEIMCEDDLTPTPASVISPSTPSDLTTAAAKPEKEVDGEEEDVLDEVIADGFIVDTKETTTTSVKNELLEDTNLGGLPSQLPPLEDTASIATTITNVSEDPEAMTEEPEVDGSFTSEEPTVVTPEQDTTAFPKETTEATTDLDTTEQDATVDATTEETIQNFVNTEVEGSGMSPDPIAPTSIAAPVGDLPSTTRLLWFPDAVDGSGMDPEGSTSIPPTTEETPEPTTTEDLEEPYFLEPEIDVVVQQTETKAEGPFKPKGRINLPSDPDPTTSARAAEGTPGWLIIFAFCMTLGAIVCILAGIATKDKWYGPSRRSLDMAGADESSKAATLPLSEKEQELVTLMNGGNKPDKDSSVISVDEVPEKEYLM